MLDPIAAVLIFIAVIAVTAVLFGAWLIASIVGLVCRVLAAPFRRKRPAPRGMLETDVVAALRCASDRCRAENPPVALFCRRCGAPMRPSQQVPVRRVAMW